MKNYLPEITMVDIQADTKRKTYRLYVTRGNTLRDYVQYCDDRNGFKVFKLQILLSGDIKSDFINDRE